MAIAGSLVAAPFLLASPAQAAATGAASVVSSTKVQYTAGSGKTNKVTITRSGRTVTIDDKVTIKPGKGCKRVGKDVTKVRCTTSKTPTWVRIHLGDRNDWLQNKSDLGISVYAGSGNDTVYGGPRADSLYGDSGKDKLWGSGGNDRLDGSDGNDRLDGGAGNDSINGGTGADSILARGGDDKIWGMTGNDTIWAGPGADTIWDDLPGRESGADYYSGGAGRDSLYYVRDEKVWLDADGVKGDDGAKGEHDTIAKDIEVLS
ncbi:hypothetical protein Ahu01nite_031210 [Winogradskya humida]|uniref:Hemolysin type calcium-binding protein n=1 Tax=Winogradskya humida TaxID=113566 RepID=A0ABQ3ZN59_9ACTN|nr:hypothetical protein Ahu01nite_031210 [Actinoplanes humidus]